VNPAFLAGAEPRLTPSGDPSFDAWRLRLMESWGASWRPYLLRLFDGLRPIQVNPERLNSPENAAAVFVSEIVTPERIAEGRRRAVEPWLQGDRESKGRSGERAGRSLGRGKRLRTEAGGTRSSGVLGDPGCRRRRLQG
jgi:hypothetical protein